ncbi:MAG TPA: LuxR C-terminal-related transcriptional regulator [Microbacterium sp.]|nr:LuxR C-terminal-related transcriptional regulator [Microbacterium sp.]
MAASDALALARSAVAAQRWREACDRFAEAGSTLFGGLTGPDLELFATSLFLRGRCEPSFDALTAAHEYWIARDDALGAARTAGRLALELLEAGEVARTASWAAQGTRLIDRLAEPDSLGGFVALVPAALTAMFVGDIDDAVRRFDEIAVIAERTGDRELAAHAAFGRGKSLTTIGRTAEGFASLDRMMAILAEGEVSPTTTCVFYRATLDIALEGFDLDRAEAWTDSFARWCLPQPELIAYSGQCHAYRAQLLLLHGEWAEAAGAAALAEERLRAGDFTAGFVADYQLAELHRLRGEFRRSEDHYRRAAQSGWDPQPGLALLLAAAGDPGAAQKMIRRSSAGAGEATRRRLLPAVVDIEIVTGDVAAARRAADDLNELRRSTPTPTPLLVATAIAADAHVLLAEGDAPKALEAAERARSAWSALNFPFEEARCRELLGRVHAARTDSDAASTEFEAARAVFLALGARPALTALAELTGDRTAGVLTPREVEVLRLVSTGLTNRAVGARLSLSEKTVARHLSNIFGKLGLSSRSAATAYAYQHGLL